MQQLGHDFLAASCFAGYQHVDIRVGDITQRAAQIFHDRRLPDQRQIAFGVFHGLAKHAVLQHQLALFPCAANAVHKPVGGKRLCDEIVSAILYRLHSHGNIAMAGNQDYWQIRVDYFDTGEKL